MENSKIYQEMFKEWLRVTGIKEGDTVVLRRAWKDGEQGYNNKFAPHWKSYVGKKMKVIGLGTECMVFYGVNAPYFVLELVETKKEVAFSNRIATVNDGKITCGCCKLTKNDTKAAIQAFETLSKLFSSYNFNIYVEGTTISRDNIKELKELL